MDTPRASALLLSLLLAACGSSRADTPAAAPKPVPTNLSPQVRTEMRSRLDRFESVFHVGCKDEEKGSCQDPRRDCGKDVGSRISRAVSKGEVAIEWEEPRATWMKNEGVLDQYWFVKPDGSGDHYWLIPSPDDVQTVCQERGSPTGGGTPTEGGTLTYCGWHKESLGSGTLLTAAPAAAPPKKAKGKKAPKAAPAKALHLTPAGGKEIADLTFCPPPPPQPDSYQ